MLLEGTRSTTAVPHRSNDSPSCRSGCGCSSKDLGSFNLTSEHAEASLSLLGKPG